MLIDEPEYDVLAGKSTDSKIKIEARLDSIHLSFDVS